MGPVERKLTAITTVVVFAAGIWVVIFAPFMVNDDGNNQFHIIDYSFTKGIDEAATLAKSHCASAALSPAGWIRNRPITGRRKHLAPVIGSAARLRNRPEG